MTALIFLIFAAIAVICGINLVVQTHPIASALSLIGVMGSLAILYLQLGGEFIAMAQIIVYAGAVMVLFIFVIMLLNAGAEERRGRSWTAPCTRPAWLLLFDFGGPRFEECGAGCLDGLFSFGGVPVVVWRDSDDEAA